MSLISRSGGDIFYFNKDKVTQISPNVGAFCALFPAKFHISSYLWKHKENKTYNYS